MYPNKEQRNVRLKVIDSQLSALEQQQRENAQQIQRLVGEKDALYIIDQMEKHDETIKKK